MAGSFSIDLDSFSLIAKPSSPIYRTKPPIQRDHPIYSGVIIYENCRPFLVYKDTALSQPKISNENKSTTDSLEGIRGAPT